MDTEFIVKTASANMPSACWGRYGRVAVLEVERGAAPKMISERARGVVRVVATWEKCHIGKTERGAFQTAVREAQRRAAKLNAR